MTRARSVVAAIDDALVLAALAPVIAIRMARAGCSCLELTDALRLHGAGLATPYAAFLDAPKTSRHAKRRHAANRVARKARRRNRS